MALEKNVTIKNVMEKYNVSRDTLIHYEKKKLLESIRKENGYRMYDEYNVKKLELILRLRSQGFSINEIMTFMEGVSVEENLEFYADKINKTENNIQILRKQLLSLNIFADRVYDFAKHVAKPTFNESFFYCKSTECAEISDILGVDLTVCQIDKNGGIEDTYIEKNVLVSSDLKNIESCKKCTRKNCYTVMRTVIRYYEEEDIQKEIKRLVNLAETVGFRCHIRCFIKKIFIVIWVKKAF